MKIRYILLFITVMSGVLFSQAKNPDSNAESMLREGVACLEGASGDIDQERAWTLLNKAYNAGSVNALYHIAQMYRFGMHVGEDQTKYMACLRQAASQGDTDATTELGVLNLYGNRAALVQQNENEGLRLLRISADKGHPLAYLYLGYAYEHGMGASAANPEEAYKMYTKAATAGNTQALVEKARCLAFGKGVMPDASEAFKILERAGSLGNPEALCVMGDMYQAGRGVMPNDTIAMQYYTKAMNAGYTNAYTKTAMMFLNGRGVPVDHYLTFTYFKKAADAGVAEGLTGLGLCHEYAINAPLDPEMAVTYYRMGADAGDAEAFYRLYDIFRYGKHKMQANPEVALEYLRKGISGGNSNSKFAMGKEFLTGELLPKDREKGLQMIHQASDDGSSVASAWLGNQYYSGKDHLNRDYSKAFVYLRRVADQPGALDDETLATVYRNLSACYRFGRGVTQNVDLAHAFATMSNNLGDEGMSTVIHYDNYLKATQDVME